MSDPRAFLSFDFDHDLVSKILFAGQAKEDSPTPFTLQDWSSKEPLPQSEWERLISNKISRCHLMIVLVGPHTSTAAGVKLEIKMANSLNVPFFGVYVGGANTMTTLPVGLSQGRVIDWKWADIGSAVSQLMTEGKNA